MRAQIVQDARLLEQQRALRAFLVGIEGVAPLEPDSHLHALYFVPKVAQNTDSIVSSVDSVGGQFLK